MRHCRNLNGIWDFSFDETGELSGKIPANMKFNGAMTVPGCFDVMSPWFGERGIGRFEWCSGKNIFPHRPGLKKAGLMVYIVI